MTMHEEESFDQNTREALTHVIRGPRSHLQRKGRPLGERLFAETPEQIVTRLEQYWNAPQEVAHDANDLTIADSVQTSKSKPKPRSETEGDDTDREPTEELPALMQEYSDKWYRPDSDTYKYAVRTSNGTRAYRKTEDGAASVIETYYEADHGDRGHRMTTASASRRTPKPLPHKSGRIHVRS